MLLKDSRRQVQVGAGSALDGESAFKHCTTAIERKGISRCAMREYGLLIQGPHRTGLLRTGEESWGVCEGRRGLFFPKAESLKDSDQRRTATLKSCTERFEGK